MGLAACRRRRVAAPQDFALDSRHEEVGGDRAGGRAVVGLDVQQPDAVAPGLATESRAALDWHRPPVLQPDPTAEKHDRRVRAAIARVRAAASSRQT